MDHDGTMAPTMERQHKWFNYYWSHQINKERTMGKEFPYQDFKSFMKMYNEKINHPLEVQNVYDFLNLDCDMNDFSHPVWPSYKSFALENPSRLYSGMKEAIEDIWNLGRLTKDFKVNRRLRLGVNTSNSWNIVSSDLSKNDVLKYFDCFVSKEILLAYDGNGNASSIKKPSKVSLALALGLLDSPGEYVLHVGDTLNDLVASQKIIRLNPMHPETLITVGVSWGYEGKKRLKEGVEVPGQGRVHFNHIISKPFELFGIVEKYFKN